MVRSTPGFGSSAGATLQDPTTPQRTAPEPAASASTTMRAIVQPAYGSADVLSLQHIAKPAVSDDDVLVRVHAASLGKGMHTSSPASRTSFA